MCVLRMGSGNFLTRWEGARVREGCEEVRQCVWVSGGKRKIRASRIRE
ncbi:hypothetical protein COLO4_36817 [Corchorus olitorius]|uniref:Uncharacterized protein n=1 Tax=Corchorus olitorius TaxID=93759 RepID=A0A1R3G543_9ROSI|nr:hypothetical protein COLO4_36817 [Corchorus olitorius]